MHEMSIAVELVRQTCNALEARPEALRATEVEVELGVLQLVVPEALEQAWLAATEGTSLEGTALTMHETPASGRCRACGREFPVSVDTYLCPGCGEADVTVLAGNAIILKSIECETPDEEASGGQENAP